jgi:hypothetical protein
MIFFFKSGHLGGYSKPLMFRPFFAVGRLRTFIRFFLIHACPSLNVKLAKRDLVPLSQRERARREGNGHGESLSPRSAYFWFVIWGGGLP